MATKSTYHKTDLMGTFFGDKFYTTNQDLRASDIVYVVSSKGSGESLVPFLEGCFRVENSERGRFEVKGDLYGYKATLSVVIRPDKPIVLSAMRDKEGKRKFASRFMNVAKPILSKQEVEDFDLLLEDTSSGLSFAISAEDDLSQDLDEILQSETETKQLILARIGQGKFRKNVTDVWGAEKEVCTLTGIAVPAILTASHIIPWKECTGENASFRLDGANGMLLCAHIDRLFDRYLLSFLQKGNAARIRFSKVLPPDVLRQLGLTDDLELVPNRMSQPNKERFFKCISHHHAKFTAMEADR